MRSEITISVPGSKSITQRALVVASLSAGRSLLSRACLCDDSLLLKKALESMGTQIRVNGETWEVRSRGMPRLPGSKLSLGNAGTAVRFLGAFSLLLKGDMELDGNEAMRQRPQDELFHSLEQLGVGVQCSAAAGRLPALLKGPAGPAAGSLKASASITSQHVSGLLMVAPLLPEGLEIEVPEGSVSTPYIRMTEAVMRRFGVEVERKGDCSLKVPHRAYSPTDIEIEGDASSGAMLLAAGSLTGKNVILDNIPPDSIQGDAVFPGILEKLSLEGDISLDMRETPDLVPPAVAAALFRRGQTHLRGIAHLRAKETDRIGVLARELQKIGADLSEERDCLRVVPSKLRAGAVLDPHGDHRMAMTFALVGLKVPGIEIKDPGCVSKSFPDFFEVLARFQ